MRVRVGASPVAERMRAWRRDQGHTQVSAASLLNTRSDVWARWERGEVWPDPGWRKRIKALVEAGTAQDGTPLSRALEHYRHTHALSQVEAARRVGVGRRTWQAWENGERRPSKAQQGRIWRVLDGEMREFGGAA